MPQISTSTSLQIFAFICSIFLQFIAGSSDDTSNSKIDGKGSSSKSHSSGIGAKMAIIGLAVVVVLLFSFFLFKLWQKKKREEQYARLLKLFEEDDELEVELGLKD